MAKSVNQVTLLGYVGNDPEIKRFGERAVVSFSLATSESWKDKTTQEWKEKTQWHRVSAWSPLAEIIEKNVKKGSRIFCQGKVMYESWQDRDGNTKYATKIEIRDLVILDPKKDASGAVPGVADKPQPNNADPSTFAGMPSAIDTEDDDLPF